MTISLAQHQTLDWAQEVFGPEVENAPERVLRHVEEAIELAQATGVRADQVHRLVDYIFSRDPGEPEQEIAGSLITLLVAASSLNVAVESAFLKELERIWKPEAMNRIRRRQTEKRRVTG